MLTQTTGKDVGRPRADDEQGPATTRKERALWLLERLVPGTGINNLGIALHVDSPFDPAALAEALSIALSRYPALRTVFTANGSELTKEILEPAGFHVPFVELELSAGPLRDIPLKEELTRFVSSPLPLDGSPLVRAGLASRPDGDVLCLVVHHLVLDVTSAAVLMRRLIVVYEALAAGQPLPEDEPVEPAPAADVPISEADLDHWRAVLEGYVPDGLDLWCQSPRPNRPRMTGGVATRALSEAGRAAVQQLQRQVRAPIAAVLLAAYYVLLASHGAGPDLVVGTPLDVRQGSRADEVGYHVNVVPLRLRVDFAEGFRSFSRQVRDRFLAAMAHAGVSVDDLMAEMPRTSSSWQTSLYRHVFNYLPQVGTEQFTVDGSEARLLSVDHGYAKFDLELVVIPAKAELSLRYNTELLSRTDIEALLRRYEAILIEAAADADRPVGEYAGWSDSDREVVAAANHEGEEPPPDCRATVAEAVRDWASQAPQALAVAEGDEPLSYGLLWEAARVVRAALLRAGVQPGDVVPVATEGVGDLAAAALGIWRARAVCFPLDPAADTDQLCLQLARSGARLLLAVGDAPAPDGTGLEVVRVPGGIPAEPGDEADRESREDGDDADVTAWLFADTASAEPGEPVAVSHRAITTMVNHFARELGAEPGTGTLASAGPASFGVLLELFLPLSTGGLVVAAPAAAWAAGADLGEVINRHDVRIVPVPPGVLPRALESAGDWPTVLRIVVQGEDLPPALARRLVAVGTELHTVHGIPETAGWGLSYVVGPDRSVLTRGRPVTGVRASVLAPDGRELPSGVRGELSLAGTGAGAEAEAGGVRTGVLARWCADGTIERLGPVGEQAVIGGLRVDVADVDAVLREHPGVAAAATVAVAGTDGGTVLVSFVVPEDDTQPAEELAAVAREHAQGYLPEAAVPVVVECLEQLPRRADGRFDRGALVRLAAERAGTGPGAATGVDAELVQGLIELWQRLLRKEVTAETGFFAVGGHSLLAAKLAQDIEEQTGVYLELVEIFSHPTPAALAVRIAEVRADG